LKFIFKGKPDCSELAEQGTERLETDCTDEQLAADCPTTPRPITTKPVTTDETTEEPTTKKQTTEEQTTTEEPTTPDPTCVLSEWSEVSLECILPDQVSTKTRTKTCGNEEPEEQTKTCNVPYCTCKDKPDFCGGVNEICTEEKENTVISLHCKCMHPFQKDSNDQCTKCIALRPFSQQCYGLEDGVDASASGIYISLMTVFITLFLL